MRRLSPALVLALIALFAALGGSTIAATQNRLTSTKQIKPNVLRYLKGDTGKTGKRGKTGRPGPPGPAPFTRVQQVEGSYGILPGFRPGGFPTVGVSIAECPAGTTLIGGGGEVSASGPSGGRATMLRESAPDGPSRWLVTGVNLGPDQYSYYQSGRADVHAWALCAS